MPYGAACSSAMEGWAVPLYGGENQRWRCRSSLPLFSAVMFGSMQDFHSIDTGDENMNCLIETALLTHGLRSVANEELAQSWHCPDAILAWVDGGELKLGPIGEYLPFRERSEELIRIDCDHLEEALQTGASGALTASGTMAVCRRLDIPMAITCGMGGIGDLRGEELCPDLPALMNIPVALISTSPKDMLDRPATLDWLRRHGVHTAGEPCTGYLFCGEPVALELPLSSCNNEKIKVVSTYSGDDEAKYITQEIQRLKYNDFDYEQMAVLVRTASQTRAFEECFIKEGIPYKVVGGLKFYERAEIRDMLAYFRLVLQPSDDLAFERIINKPARGIGEKTIDKFRNRAKADAIPLYQAMVSMTSEGAFSGKTKNALENFINLMTEWRRIMQAIPLGEFAETIVDESGYMAMLEQDKSVEAPGRIENIKELISVMSDEENYPNLAEFLEHVSLVIDNEYNDNANKVIVSTLHAAKGLEFDAVFLPGWEEGIFPHQKCLDGDDGGIEEERRLAYVAITRARRLLYITMAFNRKLYGQWQNNMPSRFLNELPPSCIELINNTGYGSVSGNTSAYSKNNNNYSNSYSSGQHSKHYGNYDDEYAGGYRSSYGSRYNGGYKKTDKGGYFDSYESAAYDMFQDDETSYKKVKNDYFYQTKKTSPLTGTRVHHSSFGYGRITGVDGDKCEVIFDGYGKKKIMKSFLEFCES